MKNKAGDGASKSRRIVIGLVVFLKTFSTDTEFSLTIVSKARVNLKNLLISLSVAHRGAEGREPRLDFISALSRRKVENRLVSYCNSHVVISSMICYLEQMVASTLPRN